MLRDTGNGAGFVFPSLRSGTAEDILTKRKEPPSAWKKFVKGKRRAGGVAGASDLDAAPGKPVKAKDRPQRPARSTGKRQSAGFRISAGSPKQ